MNTTPILAALTLGLSLTAAHAQDAQSGNNYPTADRVQFVEECINDYPDKGRFEMIHKCSCLVDTLAKNYTYDQFVDMSTAFKAFTISGERGNVVRDTPMGKALNAEYKKAITGAREACFLN
jgi:hypothetical protein